MSNWLKFYIPADYKEWEKKWVCSYEITELLNIKNVEKYLKIYYFLHPDKINYSSYAQYNDTILNKVIDCFDELDNKNIIPTLLSLGAKIFFLNDSLSPFCSALNKFYWFDDKEEDDLSTNLKVLELLVKGTDSKTFIKDINQHKNLIISTLMTFYEGFVGLADICNYRYIITKNFNSIIKFNINLIEIFLFHGVNFCEYFFSSILQSKNLLIKLDCYKCLLLSTVLFEIGKAKIINSDFFEIFVNDYCRIMFNYINWGPIINDNMYWWSRCIKDHLKTQKMMTTIIAKIIVHTKTNILNENILKCFESLKTTRFNCDSNTYFFDDDIKKFIFEDCVNCKTDDDKGEATNNNDNNTNDELHGFVYKGRWVTWDRFHRKYSKRLSKLIIKRLNLIPRNFHEFVQKNVIYDFDYSNSKKKYATIIDKEDWKKAILTCV